MLFDGVNPPLDISILLRVNCILFVDFLLDFECFLLKIGGFKFASVITLVLHVTSNQVS